MSGHLSPKSTYYAIFGALMVLTGITVAAAFVTAGAVCGAQKATELFEAAYDEHARRLSGYYANLGA